MKGIYHLVSSGALDDPRPWRVLSWSESQAMRTDETAWLEAWKRVHQVRPVIAWQSWPQELARDWLGLDCPPLPPPLPENVRALLEQARPLLVSGH
ncbi:hypothetical protein ACIBU0_42480 [Streptomyces sp. NPDC049627]|uniref:hypothetical protein n=1 Tax=Streptomyces sp. NPDC049627 TaxID=3365595 RepID=UPI0037AFE0AE